MFPHPDKYNNDIPPVISNLRFEWGSYQKVSEQRNTYNMSGPKTDVHIDDKSRPPMSICKRMQLRLPLKINVKFTTLSPWSNDNLSFSLHI